MLIPRLRPRGPGLVSPDEVRINGGLAVLASDDFSTQSPRAREEA
jgi:hypothetical protein